MRCLESERPAELCDAVHGGFDGQPPSPLIPQEVTKTQAYAEGGSTRSGSSPGMAQITNSAGVDIRPFRSLLPVQLGSCAISL